jgi:tRNA modification GTPase
MPHIADTIAAIATPPGKGGVGIIRISGSEALAVAEAISKKKLKPRYATYASFQAKNNSIIDEGLILYFPSPNSFTGEDVIEFQGHGGPVILDVLLKEILSYGVRMARAGEFSERAFLNDKMDLTQAEAIADLINSGSEQAALAAVNSLQGTFSSAINTLSEKLIKLRMYVEASIDFPEEEIDFLSDNKISAQLADINQTFECLFKQAQQGCLLQEGINVVIIGKPNAGKSSLLNQLSGQDSAIVTDIAGTTRDVLKEFIQIDGLPLHLIDTAGLRETDDAVEKVGVARAHKEIEKADFILCLIDAAEFSGIDIEDLIHNWNIKDKQLLLVKNKIDLSHEKAGLDPQQQYDIINISAKTGSGIDELKTYIKKKVGFEVGTEGCFSARRRHMDALRRAYELVKNGEQQLKTFKAGELLAEDLNQAQKNLSEITGEFTADDLLGEIFSNFCIGK